jgi:predicted DsbA family dithiol-disulfide isomerase
MEKTHQARKQKNPEKNNQHTPDRLVLTYYTDPLCCWCWGFETTWQKLLAEYGHRFDVRYVMSGMIRDWKHYSDPYNAVSNPSQMGPVWLQVARTTHTELQPDIWHTDPPESSYPSCIAVKTAALQSRFAEEKYLFKVRQAVMTRGMNIARASVLIALAEELKDEDPAFDIDKFRTDLRSGAGVAAFRKDLEQTALHKIGRFPTLTCTEKKSGTGIMMVGYRAFEPLIAALKQAGL